MVKISEMDWAQHTYAQNLRKDSSKAKMITFRRFIDDVACPFSMKSQRIEFMKYIQFYEIVL